MSNISFEVPKNPRLFKSLNKLLDECIRTQVKCDGIRILSVEEAPGHPHLARRESILMDSNGRTVLDKRYMQEFAQLDSSEMKVMCSNERRLRNLVLRLLRMRKTGNIFLSEARKFEDNINRCVLGMIKPIEHLSYKANTDRDVVTNIFLVVRSRDGNQEYRYRLKTENPQPGHSVKCKCVKYVRNGGIFLACNSELVFTIPVDKTIEDLYYENVWCRVLHGVHNACDCVYKKSTRFCNNQTNLIETASAWKANKQRCLRRRATKATSIFNAFK